MSDVLRVQWTITPATAPEPWLNCNRCRGTTRFRSSGKIRLNANGKRLDAWLIYRCTSCDNTWNRPILDRRHIATIEPRLLVALQANDPDLCRRFAFETSWRTAKVDHAHDVTVRKQVMSDGPRPARRLEIVCVVPETTGLRVDRLLAIELCLSRSRIQDMQNAGHLVAWPRSLRRSLRSGLRVTMELSGVQDGDKIVLAATGREA